MLVIGGSGQVGYHLLQAAKRRNLQTLGTFNATVEDGLRQLDVRDAGTVERLVQEIAPSTILMPASATNVDRCEEDPRAAYEVNVVGLANVITAANAAGATLVYFSSDYIFDGRAGPYDERSPANPICHYGTQKLIAEHLVLAQAKDALIVRTTVVYGWEPQGKNFVNRLLRAFGAGERITVPSDQIGSPTYAPDLADATLDLLADGARGIVDVVGRELAARDELARETARVFGYGPALVEAVPTAALGQAAARPLNAGMLVELAERRLGRELVGYTAGLRRMLTERPASQEGPDRAG
jgi:dTDP-4-dehydrorhamnose reductase